MSTTTATTSHCSCTRRPVWHRNWDDVVWDAVDCWTEDEDVSVAQEERIADAYVALLSPYIRPVRGWLGRVRGYHLCIEMLSRETGERGTLYLRLHEAARAVAYTPEEVAS
jgi:hypothetical protein